MKRLGMFLLAVLLLVPLAAGAEQTADEAADAKVWQLVDEGGKYLTSICYQPEANDSYLAGNNHLYEVVRVENGTATLRDLGEQTMPDVSWLDMTDSAQPVSALLREKHLAFYCTHSDESYEPSDGYYSTTEHGSVYQVAQALADALGSRGITCEVSDALHHPHDAGAYRRSRQTAMELVKSMPDAIFDIHRDGIPNPDEYAVTLGGKDASKIRLLVGRGNQNMEVNKEFALLVKAVGDKVYPGLIKDIYMGKGVFNQDLLPHALLLECGTYTLSKDAVLNSMPLMADIIDRALYGGVTGSAGTSDARGTRTNTSSEDGITMGATDVPVAQQDAAASGKGILWLVGLLVVGLIIFGIVSTGSLKDGLHKAGRNISEMTGGMMGKKPDDEDPGEEGK